MQSSPYGLFIIVDYRLTFKLKFREIYYYIYYKTYILITIRGWCFLEHVISRVVVKKKMVSKLVNRIFLC